MSHRLHVLFALLTAAAIGVPAARAAEGTYPDKPLRMVVPTAPGGPTDFVARQLAQHLAAGLKQPVLVQNVPGASGALGTAEVVRDKPDGYTLLFTLNTPITLLPSTNRKVGYDVRRDLVPLAHVASTPLVLYVGTRLDVTTFSQFRALAGRRGANLSYGYPGTGSSFHILGEYLNRTLGLDLVGVPYKGAAPMLNDLVGGQLSAAINDIGVSSQFVRTGRLRALAATGARRSPAAPDIPTFGELGVKDTERLSPWWGLFMRAGTPDAVVTRVSGEVLKALADPALKARLLESGYEVTALGPAETVQAIDEEMVRWRDILSRLGDLKFE